MKKKRPSKQDKQPPAAEETPRPSEEATDAEALAAERDDLLGRLQRVSADYLNYQKRVGRDIDEARQFANAEVVRDLLAVLDDMERALDAARASHAADDPLLTGMQLVYDKALEVLGRHGVQPIEAEGQPFDPNRHEAMMQQPAPEHDSPTVLQELQRGYELRGRVIRPARVIVGMPPAQGQDEPSPADESPDQEDPPDPAERQ